MPHLEDGTLHALIDGALRAESPERAERAERHIEGCEDCRARLEAATRLRDEAASILEAAAPATAAAPDFVEVRARAAGGPRTSHTESARRAGILARDRRARRLAWAASLVVALGTGYLLRGVADPVLVRDREEPAPASTETGQPPIDRVEAAPGAAPSGASATRDQAGDRGDGTAAERLQDAGAAPGPVPAEESAPRRREAAGEPVDITGARSAPARPATPLANERPSTEVAEARTRAEPASAGAADTASATAAPLLAAAPSTDAAHWTAASVEEARRALDGPLYLLPGARILEVHVDRPDGRRVLSLQELQTGVPVRVVQRHGAGSGAGVENPDAVSQEPGVATTGDAARETSEPLEAEEEEAPMSLEAGKRAELPGMERVEVVRGAYVLELSATLPAELLAVLGEAATPAP